MTSSSKDKFACLQDIEDEAVKILPKSALGYYKSGADQMQTLEDNRKAFQRYYYYPNPLNPTFFLKCIFWKNRYKILPKMLHDVSARDLSTQITWSQGKGSFKINIPIGIAPTAWQKMAHPQGELASVQAAQKQGTIFIMSTNSNSSIEEVAQAAPECQKWFQLYIYKDREARPVLNCTRKK